MPCFCWSPHKSPGNRLFYSLPLKYHEAGKEPYIFCNQETFTNTVVLYNEAGKNRNNDILYHIKCLANILSANDIKGSFTTVVFYGLLWHNNNDSQCATVKQLLYSLLILVLWLFVIRHHAIIKESIVLITWMRRSRKAYGKFYSWIKLERNVAIFRLYLDMVEKDVYCLHFLTETRFSLMWRNTNDPCSLL